MSEQFIDTTSDEYLEAPKALRDAYDRLKSRYQETTQERDALKGRATDAALGDALRGFKNPERVKRDLLAEGIDPLNTEAVNSWLGNNGDDYARGEATPVNQSQTPDSAEEAAAFQQLQAARSLTQPADMSKLEAALTEITPDMTPEQVIEVYRKRGV